MKTISQIMIDTPDAKKLADFYRTFFWTMPESVGTDPTDGPICYLLKFDGSTSILLVQKSGKPARTGQTQITLSVGSEKELNSLAASLVRGGVAMMQAPRNIYGLYRCSFADPDGNLIFITA